MCFSQNDKKILVKSFTLKKGTDHCRYFFLHLSVTNLEYMQLWTRISCFDGSTKKDGMRDAVWQKPVSTFTCASDMPVWSGFTDYFSLASSQTSQTVPPCVNWLAPDVRASSWTSLGQQLPGCLNVNPDAYVCRFVSASDMKTALLGYGTDVLFLLTCDMR